GIRDFHVTGVQTCALPIYGDFFQQPENEILKFTDAVEAQHTQHYIFNYQYSAKNRIFRAEVYRKQYSNLVTYNESMPDVNSVFTDRKSTRLNSSHVKISYA